MRTKKGKIRRYKRNTLTRKKLELLILRFLDEREADLAADYQPESEIWRQLLAKALADFIEKNALRG